MCAQGANLLCRLDAPRQLFGLVLFLLDTGQSRHGFVVLGDGEGHALAHALQKLAEFGCRLESADGNGIGIGVHKIRLVFSTSLSIALLRIQIRHRLRAEALGELGAIQAVGLDLRAFGLNHQRIRFRKTANAAKASGTPEEKNVAVC